MRVKAIEIKTGKEKMIEIELVGSLYKNVTEQINVYTKAHRPVKYTKIEELFLDWKIISKPELPNIDSSSILEQPLLYERYIDLSNQVLSKYREYSLKKIGI